MVILGKLVDSVSINPVLSTIEVLRWFAKKQLWLRLRYWRRHLISKLQKPMKRHLYLLKVAQTSQSLPRPGWPLKEDGNEINRKFAQLLCFMEINWSKDRVDTAAQDLHAHPRFTNTITIAIAFKWSCS